MNGICVTYPQRRSQPALVALDRVDLVIERGQFAAMLGPNGSGKSTLMKVITGLLRPGAGEVEVFGSADSAARRRRLGVVFQGPSLDRHMTVWENLRDHAALYGAPRDAVERTVRAELQRTGLDDRRHALVKTLSGGMARQVDLIRATLNGPGLLLLDEPTVGLDPSAREQFLARLESLRRESGVTMLMTTHLVDEADRADRVILMHRGQIVADDAPVRLRQRAGVRWVTVLGGDWRPTGPQAAEWRPGKGGWSLPIASADHASQLAQDLASAGVAFSMAPPTLADAFEQLTGESLTNHHAA